MGETTNNNNPSIPVGDIAFFDNYLPSLDAGEYTISVKASIENFDSGTYFDNPITQDFEVRGPQFSLPATEVHSVYPAADSNSAFDQYLPNIVLNKRVLPWERYLIAGNKTTPWLCLLVFAEGEINIDPKTRSALKKSTVKNFLTPGGEVLKPSITTDSVSADVLSSQLSYIQISKAVFDALVPKLDELEYLAHVRQVDTGHQAVMGFEDQGWFSVITGNRLLKSTAATGTRYFVHLVSLEGYDKIMGDKAPWPTKTSDPQQPQDIALVSLYNWTFLSQPEKLNFKELVENFAAQGAKEADNLLLRRPVTVPDSPDAATKAAATRFREGYVPLNYDVPKGEKTFAWYRGPLTPTIAQPLPRASQDYHFPSASSLIVYDKTTGIFDQSYAAAWSIGRALALADGSFSQALLQYRKKSYRILGKMTDVLQDAKAATSADLKQVSQQSVVRDIFKQMISQDIGPALTKHLSGPAPKASRPKTQAPSNNTSPVDQAKTFFAQKEVQASLKEEIKDDLGPVAVWLARKQLLYGVPFDHLVPDQLALPQESLRFFYLDQNWLDCLVDGALSIGVQSSKDTFFNQAMRGVINDALVAEKNAVRDKLLFRPISNENAEQETCAGILIRSSVVAGWPGLVVKGFVKGDYATGTPLKMLRMERLSSNVLLCIFQGIPSTVMLAEPQQGLCFGVEDGDIIQLRKLTGQPGAAMGINFPAEGGFQAFYRKNPDGVGENVLNIQKDGGVVQTMQQSQYLNATIGPAQFAMEMVKAPEEISFEQPQN